MAAAAPEHSSTRSTGAFVTAASASGMDCAGSSGSRPSFRAAGSRVAASAGVPAINTRAPNARAARPASRPIGPGPVTRTTSSGCGGWSSTACSATVVGSASAACRGDSDAGRRCSSRLGTATASASPPGSWIPNRRRSLHTFVLPARHGGQRPHQMTDSTATASPGWNPRSAALRGACDPAAEPISLTMPANSCPRITGVFVHCAIGCQCAMCRSLPQIDAPATSTITSSSRGVGRGTSRSSSAPGSGATLTSAFIRDSLRPAIA